MTSRATVYGLGVAAGLSLALVTTRLVRRRGAQADDQPVAPTHIELPEPADLVEPEVRDAIAEGVAAADVAESEVADPAVAGAV